MANKLATEKKVSVISMLAEGNSIRAVERITGVNQNTIMSLNRRIGDACAKIMDEKMRGLTCKNVEIDEIWGFIGAKRKNAERAGVYGDVWTFIALDADTKLIPSFIVGKRDAYRAVDTNFVDETTSTPVSTLAHPHPPEISMSLDRLRAKYPDPKKLGFLVMRFTAAKPFAKIVEIIKQTGEKHGLQIIRADENEFHADLWGNVRTHLHGCGFGIAIYERIETDEPNANVGLEVGYFLAMNKPVLLLKDKTVETLQADLAGKLYKQFDPHDPEGTIPNQLTKWLEDYGIVVSKKE